MKLDKTLNFKKVRCVDNDAANYLTIGNVYQVLGINYDNTIKVFSDTGSIRWCLMSRFEPVLEPAENPLQGVELTPEFEAEASYPKFKVGDRVYYGSEPDVLTILEFDVDGLARMDSWAGFVDSSRLCHATLENYERLQATFPGTKFEKPPTQADIDNEAVDKLAQAMKNKLAKKREQGYHGWATCKHGDLVQLLINHVDKGDPIDVANFCAFLFARGEQLTQAVLDE